MNQKLSQKTVHYKVNPKALSTNNLYGYMSLLTNDWNDGLIVQYLNMIINDQSKIHWMIFDGPVDTIWIENLNGVLDENKTLCLANG